VIEKPLRAEIAQIKGADPSYALPALDPGVTYAWYVEAPDFKLRSPPLDTKVPYWLFATVK
jgi:hypothetical protein